MNARENQIESTVRQGAANHGLLPVNLAVADYDRTRPLIEGHVQPEGIALKVNTAWIGDFCVRPVYEEYDAAEFSLSWYVAARCRGEPVVALPIGLAFASGNLMDFASRVKRIIWSFPEVS